MNKVNIPYMDSVYEFKGLWDVPSTCGLKVINGIKTPIIIVTDLYKQNPGTTVTNYCSKLASLICSENAIDLNNFIFIQHCPDRSSKLDFYREIFERVHFEITDGKLTNPDWQEITKQKVDTLIESAL